MNRAGIQLRGKNRSIFCFDENTLIGTQMRRRKVLQRTSPSDDGVERDA